MSVQACLALERNRTGARLHQLQAPRSLIYSGVDDDGIHIVGGEDIAVETENFRDRTCAVFRYEPTSHGRASDGSRTTTRLEVTSSSVYPKAAENL